MSDNPWSLTPRQCDAMDAMVAGCCHKAAARAMGISGKTLQCYIGKIKRKMGGRNIMANAILWDRWRRT